MNKEKCAKCLRELGWQNLAVFEPLNAWLCPECGEAFNKHLQAFLNNYIRPERSKREDSNYVVEGCWDSKGFID